MVAGRVPYVFSRKGLTAAIRSHAIRQLQADVASLGVQAQLRVLHGDAADSIRDEAARSGAGLVIAGMARDEPIGRFLVGSTVQTLARTLAPKALIPPSG
jgi:nucleotide-binding universal stress UspA family protein